MAINFPSNPAVNQTFTSGTDSTLNSTVTDSNLTTVGTLNELEVSGDITADANVIVAAKPVTPTHATNKKYVDTRSIAMSIAMS